ncbi:MAG: PEP-CTERM sorting domain-containing protein [Phycisphaeraceae bacterium]|nr:PEP-CTERM sorting domain-containing protein [Phycisphaeraceae bacterium]
MRIALTVSRSMLAATILACCPTALASEQYTPAIIDPALTTTNFQPFESGAVTVGWSFRVLEPVIIKAVGFFDEGKDGLVNAHVVSIWDGDGQFWGQTYINSSTTHDLQGDYRVRGKLNPPTFAPGDVVVVSTTYRMLTDTDPEFVQDLFPTSSLDVDLNAMQVDPRIEILSTNLYSVIADYPLDLVLPNRFPTETFAPEPIYDQQNNVIGQKQAVFLAANVYLMTPEVPEPGTAVALITFGALALARRRVER